MSLSTTETHLIRVFFRWIGSFLGVLVSLHEPEYHHSNSIIYYEDGAVAWARCQYLPRLLINSVWVPCSTTRPPSKT